MVSPLCFQKAQSFCNYFLHVCSKELLSFAYFHPDQGQNLLYEARCVTDPFYKEAEPQATCHSWHRLVKLDADTPTRVAFGNYLADRQARIGGYLPVFWRSPHSIIHATGDIGQMISWISEQVDLEAV